MDYIAAFHRNDNGYWVTSIGYKIYISSKEGEIIRKIKEMFRYYMTSKKPDPFERLYIIPGFLNLAGNTGVRIQLGTLNLKPE